MRITKKVNQTKKYIQSCFGKKIGLVPTMGYLHDGHISLIKECKNKSDVTVVSIFVNPTQFGPGEDFSRYPRDFKKDEQILIDLDVDMLFYPDRNEMYPPYYSTFVEVEDFGDVLCGKSRPSHFRGVATVVLKLFNIVSPTTAYFGQKDAQQALLLRKMADDLNLNTRIRILPIIRENDGLALSSRNVYLSQKERDAAQHLPQALELAKKKIKTGMDKVSGVIEIIEGELNKSSLIRIDYVEVVTLDKMEKTDIINKSNTLVAAAIRVGKTRLIDNFILGDI